MKRLSCKWVKKNLSAYLDKELSSELTSMIENHLQECPFCKESLLEFQSLKARLNSLIQSIPPKEPPDYLAEEISFSLPKHNLGIFTDPVMRNSAIDLAILFLIITFGIRLWQAPSIISPEVLISKFNVKPAIYKTEYGHSMRITLNEKDTLFIKENSYVEIKSLFPKIELGLKYGEVLVSVKKSSLEGKFIMHTPLARIEVIGTLFKVLAKEDTTEVMVLEGRLLIRYGENSEAISENNKAIITQEFQLTLKNLSSEEIKGIKQEFVKLDLFFPEKKPVSKRPAIIQWGEIR